MMCQDGARNALRSLPVLSLGSRSIPALAFPYGAAGDGDDRAKVMGLAGSETTPLALPDFDRQLPKSVNPSA